VIGSCGQLKTLVVGVACIAAISGCGTTRKAAPARSVQSYAEFEAQGVLAPSGNPELSVSSYPDGAVDAIHWSMCPPGAGKCKPLAWSNRRTEPGPAPGPQPAGTVFKATATWKQRRYSSIVRWRGALHVTALPTLIGTPRFGATVKVQGARWSGGWGTAFDSLGIEACRTAHATGCVMLAGEYLQCFAAGCGLLGGLAGTSRAPDHARVGNWYSGWYLFALDAHLNNSLNGAVGYSSAAAIAPWPTNRIVVRSRPYGPVTGPPPPKVLILPRARIHGRHVQVATIHCATACRVVTSVQTKHPNRQNRIEWTTRVLVNGTNTVEVSGPIPAGRASVTIQVGNGPYVKDHSLIP
jgi:hypothetical protein